MTEIEFNEYWAHLRLKHAGDRDTDHPKIYYSPSGWLCHVLGWKEYDRNISYSEIVLTEEMKDLLRKLNGPHHMAVLKAYRIKRGLI